MLKKEKKIVAENKVIKEYEDEEEIKNLKSKKFARIQSPSSINTYKQCPRKYYYQYIKCLETLPSIHLIRGKLTHSVLEDFFKININNVSENNFMFELRIIIMELFKKHWQENLKEMKKLDLTEAELDFYLEETKLMIQNWFKNLVHKIAKELNKLTLHEAFVKHTPITEQEYISEKFGVHGIIDAIHMFENDVYLLDYKTSKRPEISGEYRLQLAIYALLYKEKHGKAPTKAGINFLKFDEQLIDVDKELLELAKKEIQLIHEKTQTRDINNYPKKISSLCKWHSGNCDFYDVCKNED